MLFLQVSEAQKNVGSNHAVSGLKFRILHRFLQLGYSVLLSDVDIIFLQNPFEHLYRDSDIESMTDGWDNQTAYGISSARPANLSLKAARSCPPCSNALMCCHNKVKPRTSWDKACWWSIVHRV